MVEEMTLKTIIIDWLKEHDYTGLCHYDCGCHIDDIMPCGSPSIDCVPGYSHRTDDPLLIEKCPHGSVVGIGCCGCTFTEKTDKPCEVITNEN